MSAPVTPVVHQARLDQLSARTLHDLLRLRIDVFVVEQDCAYPELDGRDAEPGTWHLWTELDGEVVACLRVLDDGEAAAIGRVATAPSARGRGLSAELVRAALLLVGGREVRIGAQTYLEHWYERFGFVRCGPDYVEDGIAHLPMRRLADTAEETA